MQRFKPIIFSLPSTLYIYLLFFILYTLQGVFELDPDFGWHLRTGQLILSHGISYTDPFSYTMPSYHFVDMYWLSNVVIAFVFRYIGLWGVSMLYAGIGIATIFLVFCIVKPVLPQLGQVAILIILLSSLFPFVGIRPQIVSWFFFALTSYILFYNPKKLLLGLLPIVFLFWTNLHGAFPIGLMLVAFALVNSYIKRFPLRHILLASSLLASLITLLSPYGIHLWQEVLANFTLSQNYIIQEWTPAFEHVIFPLWLYIVLTTTFIFYFRSLIKRPLLILSLLLLLMTVRSIRHAPFFILFTLPLLITCCNNFFLEARRLHFPEIKLHKVLLIFLAIAVGFALTTNTSLIQSLTLSSFNYQKSQSFTYPTGAIIYLQAHPFQGHLFSTYNWGGYLIWQLPQEKTFVDGRMPAWINPTAPSTESNNALLLYESFTQPKNRIPIIRKYHITTFLLPVSQQPKGLLSSLSFFKKYIGRPATDPADVFFTSLGWQIIYKDDVSIVYQKKGVSLRT